MTRYRHFALVVCLAVTVAGCSGSTSPKPLTAATAKVLAQAAILLPADLPGYTYKPQPADPTNAASQAKFDRCLGVPVATNLTQNDGTAFTKGQLEIDSSSSVVTTQAMAKTETDALPVKGLDCFKQQIVLEAGSQLTHPEVTVTPRAVTVPGADAAFVFDVLVRGTSNGQAVELLGSQAGALVGQTRIELSTIAFGPPVPTSDEIVALLTKATARVKAAS